MALDDTLALAVLRRRPPPLRRRACALGRREVAVAAARRRRRGLPRARRGAGRGRIPQGRGAGRRTAGCIRSSTCARSASRAKSWRSATGSPTSPSPCRGSAPARSRCSAPTELKRRYLPPVRDGKAIAAFALSEPEAGSDVAAMATTATARRQCTCPPRRRKDLDLERRHRRPLRGVRAHRRGAGRQGPVGLHGRCRHAGAHRRRAHRGDRAASAGDAEVRRRARAGGEPARRARRGLQGRDGDARYLPLDGRRRRARLRPPRAARDRRARRDAQAVRRAARRPADDAGRDRRQRHRGRCRGAAGLSRRLDQGSRAPRASPARPRWPRCSRPKPRSA